MITNVVILSLLVSFVFQLIDKIGLKEYAQVYGNRTVHKLFSCNFCICFWLSVLLSLVFYIFVSRNIECALYPLLITPLARKTI